MKRAIIKTVAWSLTIPLVLILFPGIVTLIYFGLASDLIKKWQIGWKQHKAHKQKANGQAPQRPLRLGRRP